MPPAMPGTAQVILLLREGGPPAGHPKILVSPRHGVSVPGSELYLCSPPSALQWGVNENESGRHCIRRP